MSYPPAKGKVCVQNPAATTFPAEEEASRRAVEAVSVRVCPGTRGFGCQVKSAGAIRGRGGSTAQRRWFLTLAVVSSTSLTSLFLSPPAVHPR